MRNRISEYFAASRPREQPSRPVVQRIRRLAQHQRGYGKRDVESYVIEHPVAAMGAAFCLGVLLAWMIKQK